MQSEKKISNEVSLVFLFYTFLFSQKQTGDYFIGFMYVLP